MKKNPTTGTTWPMPEETSSGGPDPDRRGLRRDEPTSLSVRIKMGLPTEGTLFSVPVPTWGKDIGDEPIGAGGLLSGTSNPAAKSNSYETDPGNEAKVTSDVGQPRQQVPFVVDE